MGKALFAFRDTMQATIHHLFTSPGHNFYGHHGKPAGTHPIESHQSIELVAGRGIRGDRFFDWKDHYKGQITFIDSRIIEKVRAHAGNPDLPAEAFRRNVVIKGLNLNELIGKQFKIGGILLEGSEECSPCYWMDGACGKPGTEDLMKGHGGLRCRIRESGSLSLGSTAIELA